MLGGATRYPDFTIDDEISGKTFYWEHLGLLHRDDYRRSWEKKLAWYRENGVTLIEEGGGPNGALIVTRDSDDGGLDMQKINGYIERLR